jgi:molybdopterin-guanine dinucleotide biosynthesis protein A
MTTSVCTETGMSEVTMAAVLVGGTSRRMGRDKAFIDWQGRPLARHVAEQLAQVTARVVLAGGRGRGYEQLGYPLLPDPPGLEGRGPLAGILAALGAARGPVLVAACDMPHVAPVPLATLARAARGATAAAVELEGHVQPLPGVYTPAIENGVMALLSRPRARLQDLFELPGTRLVTAAQLGGAPDLQRMYLNINELTDLDGAVSGS